MNDEQARHSHGDGATNPEVGKQLGLSYSGVSRIRSGNRYPSLAVMRKIRDAYAWPIEEQMKLIPEETGKRNMEYAHELERRILKAHNTGTADK